MKGLWLRTADAPRPRYDGAMLAAIGTTELLLIGVVILAVVFFATRQKRE